MKVLYKNKNAEKMLIVVNMIVGILVAASFIALLGFEKPLLGRKILHAIQIGALFVFLIEKIFRFINAVHKAEYLLAIWFEIPLLAILLAVVVGAGRMDTQHDPFTIRIIAVWVYLVLQVVDKICRTVVNLAASGRNPMRTLIVSFLVLILSGAGLLMLPKAHNSEQLNLIDALFTATSATCVTGLVVKDTGTDFSWAGQCIILTLIQLGGLGIMVFGAVFALLLRQAISVRESVAMQDLLSSETLGKIGTMIGFIFIITVIIETVGAIVMHGMWRDCCGDISQIADHKIFASIFHSISAFCNAGFGLCSDSLIGYKGSWQVYGLFCPLIILGGLGFGVLYDITRVGADRTARLFKRIFKPNQSFVMAIPKKLTLQSKIVLSTSAFLIIAGMVSLIVFEKLAGNNEFGIGAGFFQSVTARTAGFNIVDVESMSPPSKLTTIILMFIGGSPGSTAGGIKTVTICVIVMAAWSTIRKRSEIQIYHRAVRTSIAGRAITVAMVFAVVLLFAIFTLVITERNNNFAMSEIIFEAASALGTVGLTTGITASLTTAGKVVIIIAMLIGRLGPLTLLASLTFNLKPARYNYPNEALIVG